MDHPSFKGDLLAVNNEFCTAGLRRWRLRPLRRHGPAQPEILVQGVGDRRRRRRWPAAVRSRQRLPFVFLWQAGKKVYAVGVDNEELARRRHLRRHRIRATRSRWREHDLLESSRASEGPDAQTATRSSTTTWSSRRSAATGWWPPTGTPVTCCSNVDDPASPRYIGDSDFERAGPAERVDPPRATGTRPSSRSTTSTSWRRTRTSLRTGRSSSRSPRIMRRVPGGGGRRRHVAGLAARPNAERPGGLRRLRLPGSSAPVARDRLPAELPRGRGGDRGAAARPRADKDYDGTEHTTSACFPGEKAAEAKRPARTRCS